MAPIRDPRSKPRPSNHNSHQAQPQAQSERAPTPQRIPLFSVHSIQCFPLSQPCTHHVAQPLTRDTRKSQVCSNSRIVTPQPCQYRAARLRPPPTHSANSTQSHNLTFSHLHMRRKKKHSYGTGAPPKKLAASQASQASECEQLTLQKEKAEKAAWVHSDC